MAAINKTMQGTATKRQQGLRSVWQMVQSWVIRSRARHTLSHLDPHLLRDIGISQEAARKECEKPFWVE